MAGYGYNSDSGEGYPEDFQSDISDERVEVDCSIVYLLPQVRYTWYQTDNGFFSLYSRGAVGGVWRRATASYYIDDVKNDELKRITWKLGYQVMPVGLSIGGSKVRFFTEAGYGCQAYCDAGIKFCF